MLAGATLYSIKTIGIESAKFIMGVVMVIHLAAPVGLVLMTQNPQNLPTPRTRLDLDQWKFNLGGESL